MPPPRTAYTPCAQGRDRARPMSEWSKRLEWIDSLADSIVNLEGKSNDYLIPTPWEPVRDLNEAVTVVDVGGSTLRIAKVQHYKVTYIHKQLIDDSARDNPLDWLAKTVQSFNLPPFSLCWAFPLMQGNLCQMGKGWSLGSQDIGRPLLDRLNARLGTGLCCAVVHDAVASLVAEHSANPECKISLTWGTGINIAFKHGDSVVNTEVGMAANPPYGEFISREPYDELLLQQVQGNMLFEYMTGGAYLGRLYSLATGRNVGTCDLWNLLQHDPTAEEIVDRACYLVAAALLAVARVVSPHCTVAYTGGVIFEPVVFTRFEAKLKQLSYQLGTQVQMVPQKYGPEIGAGLLYPQKHTTFCK